MKKLLALLLASIMVFALVACGGNTKDPADKGNDDEKVANARENIKKYAWAKTLRDTAVKNAEKYLGRMDFLYHIRVSNIQKLRYTTKL